MKGLSLKTILGLAVAFAFAASPSFALSFGFHKSNDRSTNIVLVNTLKLNNGAKLAPGHYKMEVPKDTKTPDVAFYQHGKVVVTLPAKVVSEAKKNSNTYVDSIRSGKYQLLTKIRPTGWREALVFKTNQTTNKS